MLNRISYETLTKVAIYGGALSVSGCFLLYYRIQSKSFRSQDLMINVVAAQYYDMPQCVLAA